MAEIKTISVTYGRKFNLGDYNSAHLETTYWADLDPDESPVDVAKSLWETAKTDVKVQALPLIKSKTKAQMKGVHLTNPKPASTPTGAVPTGAAPAAASAAPPNAQIIEVAVKSFGIASTQGGDAYVNIKGGRYSKHGIPLYDDQMPESFLAHFHDWSSWPVGAEYTDIPEFMRIVLYDKTAKKVVGFK